MPLRNPARAIWVILKHDGPMTAAQLEERVPGALPILRQLARKRTVERDGELWRLGDGPEPKWPAD